MSFEGLMKGDTAGIFDFLAANGITSHAVVYNESYFTGFNKKTVNSKDFRDFYFKHFPVIESHGDAVIDYEMDITRYFEKKGYSFGSFIPNKMPHSLMYSTLPNMVNLNDVKYVTKKTHLKNQDNYNKWRKIK